MQTERYNNVYANLFVSSIMGSLPTTPSSLSALSKATMKPNEQLKYLLLTTIAAVVLVGCVVTQSQNSADLHSEGDNANGRKEHVPEQKAEPPSISIHKAASIGDIEAVRQHLAAGTDPNLRSPVVNSPLLFAASYEIMTLLVENGADVNDIGWGMTALHRLTDPESVMYLVDKVADVNAIDKFVIYYHFHEKVIMHGYY